MVPDKKQTLLHVSIWVGGITVGLAAVLYAKVVAWVQLFYFKWFHHDPYWVSAFGPMMFIFAAALVRKFAPDAKGSGVPQVLEAIEFGKSAPRSNEVWFTSLVSLRTALIKVLSSVVGILGGASIGREGPTVQIAASAFAWIGRKSRKWAPQVDFQNFLIAGAASGVAAAFNTPLAGITFALEELADGIFGSFRQTMMLAVIIAGVTAQGLSGDYLYFDHVLYVKPEAMVIPEALLIGSIGGFFGGWFSRFLAYPKMTRLPQHWLRRAFVCGFLCAVIGLITHGDTAGSGYEVTRRSLESVSLEQADILFPIAKLCTTVLSYLSGMAGGIFSPSLSIGAGLGISIAKLLHLPHFQICALIGMVAFFSGVVQAPLTAVVIVMEMTDEHILILPFMIAAFLAHAMGKWVMPYPLYSYLAGRHEEA